jgi:hypothetical protein
MRRGVRTASLEGVIDLYWIPLGADGHCVRLTRCAYKAIAGLDLYHAALVVDDHAIEVAPAWAGDEASRGVVTTGVVGSRLLGRWRLFRYEIRCLRGGTIPDLAHAVGGPRRLSSDPAVSRRLLDVIADVPNPVWGRDELRAGEMWNSNSVVAWLLACAGLPAERLQPPPRGRAVGWAAGLEVARRRSGASGGRADRSRSAARHRAGPMARFAGRP